MDSGRDIRPQCQANKFERRAPGAQVLDETTLNGLVTQISTGVRSEQQDAARWRARFPRGRIHFRGLAAGFMVGLSRDPQLENIAS